MQKPSRTAPQKGLDPVSPVRTKPMKHGEHMDFGFANVIMPATP
jgi:hypothetical protein